MAAPPTGASRSSRREIETRWGLRVHGRGFTGGAGVGQGGVLGGRAASHGEGADAVVLGAISETGLNKLIEEIRAKGIPVIDVINGISSPKLSAKSLVSFGEMGAKAGEYLVKMHPKGAKPVKVAWFPGPPGAGWVVAGNKGFVEAVSKGAIDIVSTKYGDTGKEVQLKLVEDVLQAYPNIDYIVGTSPTTERSE